MRNSDVKKTPPGRHHSRSPSSKKRPQPVHANDAEFHGVDEEVVDFGDNHYDNDMAVSEEEHEGSGSSVKVKGDTGSSRKKMDHSNAAKDIGSSGKKDPKIVQKSKKEDMKPKMRQARVNTRTESRGSIARRAVTKENAGSKKMRVVPLNDLNEKVLNVYCILVPPKPVIVCSNPLTLTNFRALDHQE